MNIELVMVFVFINAVKVLNNIWLCADIKINKKVTPNCNIKSSFGKLIKVVKFNLENVNLENVNLENVNLENVNLEKNIILENYLLDNSKTLKFKNFKI